MSHLFLNSSSPPSGICPEFSAIQAFAYLNWLIRESSLLGLVRPQTSSNNKFSATVLLSFHSALWPQTVESLSGPNPSKQRISMALLSPLRTFNNQLCSNPKIPGSLKFQLPNIPLRRVSQHPGGLAIPSLLPLLTPQLSKFKLSTSSGCGGLVEVYRTHLLCILFVTATHVQCNQFHATRWE